MTPLNITPYHRRHLQAVRDLLFHSNLVHTHLDWHDADAWIESSEATARLAWHRGQLVGVMGFSQPVNGACWVRLAAVREFFYDHESVLCELWDDLVKEVKPQGVELVALLVVRDWISRYAPALGFSYVEDIVTLARAGETIPPYRPGGPIIRAAEIRDLEQLWEIDVSAFTTPWQLSRDEIRQAYRIASSCTVAVLNDELVGYQLSTLYFDGAHLARLAVSPHIQGAGVGGALLGDLLQRFFRRGVYMMTVNTQASNLRSRSLYSRFGFEPNGYDLPFWLARL